MDRNFGCSFAAPDKCTLEQAKLINDFATKNLSEMGEVAFIQTTGCQPPCTVDYYEFDAPFVTQKEPKEGQEPSNFNMVTATILHVLTH